LKPLVEKTVASKRPGERSIETAHQKRTGRGFGGGILRPNAMRDAKRSCRGRDRETIAVKRRGDV